MCSSNFGVNYLDGVCQLLPVTHEERQANIVCEKVWRDLILEQTENKNCMIQEKKQNCMKSYMTSTSWERGQF